MRDKTIKVEAPAKINLYLDVLEKRFDGYHEVKMVMQTVSLCDRLTISVDKSLEDVQLEVINADIPENDDNLIIKSIRLLQEYYQIPPLKIVVDKEIPVAAGLAGGSSDAAATIWGIAELLELQIKQEQLAYLASEIGSDVPFCLLGGTSLAEGRGEKLTNASTLPQCYILLVKPPFGVSTGQVYKAVNPTDEADSRADKIISALSKGSLYKVIENMYNKMENVVFGWHPELLDLTKRLLDFGALTVRMSGSGPTIFGVFESYLDAYNVKKSLLKEMPEHEIFLTTPRDKGVGKEH
ncbi:4-(cytidine 5'-diphospho)-2-C-methyl-D-erythritol kinase [Natranaerobius trueperi]|uniref:4-(cytidine 5'-diphospho)-2-C-methyl-D-erythritol kinase n=1 Tax=Natranaerobius trueperi TaxID=759412 RepID=UPI0013033B37|nr:4-(cytidine 5'-diphospho)-2-C-methyl-D-erythritol kinase [Natranaerobius trueperi]